MSPHRRSSAARVRRSVLAFGLLNIWPSLPMGGLGPAWAQNDDPADSSPPPALPVARPAPLSSAERENALPVRVQSSRSLMVTPAAGWQSPLFDDSAWLADGRAGGAARAGASQPGDAGMGFLYSRIRFSVERAEAARSLELRIAYRDGFVAYLNGTEIARRNLPLSPAGARPLVAHGADRESIYLALPVIAAGGSGRRQLAPSDNLLAVEIRPAMGRAAVESGVLAADIAVAAFSSLRIVRGPYLAGPMDGSISVAWETDLPGRGVVRLERLDGRSARQNQRFLAARSALRQVVHLTGLSAGGRYRYRVEVEGTPALRGRAASEWATFEAAPRPNDPVRFVVYGDMRAPGHEAHALLVAAILRERPPLVLNTGDLVAVGAEESAWQTYFHITAALGASTPVAPALGNHEAYVGGAAKSWALFALRPAQRGAVATAPSAGYTSFDWGGVHFVILDSNRVDAAQRDWLARDLGAARRRRSRAIVAVCHDGPWAHGPHGGSHAVETGLAPLLAAAGADVLFSGHDHIYERGIGATPDGQLPYVVSGGGGAPLYNPTCRPSTLAQPSSPAVAPTQPAAADLDGLAACPASVAAIQKAYHYVAVEIAGSTLTMCPRRQDGGVLEPCVKLPLRAARTR